MQRCRKRVYKERAHSKSLGLSRQLQLFVAPFTCIALPDRRLWSPSLACNTYIHRYSIKRLLAQRADTADLPSLDLPQLKLYIHRSQRSLYGTNPRSPLDDLRQASNLFSRLFMLYRCKYLGSRFRVFSYPDSLCCQDY